jgi:hypothetical protein
MVAMNSIPQQEVAKGNGQSELAQPYLQHHLELWRKSFSNNTFWRLNYFYA